MKIMIDTNIFISAILNPKGRVAEALNKALSPPFSAVTNYHIRFGFSPIIKPRLAQISHNTDRMYAGADVADDTDGQAV